MKFFELSCASLHFHVENYGSSANPVLASSRPSPEPVHQFCRTSVTPPCSMNIEIKCQSRKILIYHFGLPLTAL
jgi:hypothetical protein